LGSKPGTRGATYQVPANLTRVIAGERYTPNPFLDHNRRNRKRKTQFHHRNA
jgi:hypothetical protein